IEGAMDDTAERVSLLPPPPDPSGTFSPAPSPGERRMVCLLFFETDADVLALQRGLAPLGGQIAHAAGGRCVVVYGQEAAENPARQAQCAAREMIERGLCER